MSLQEHSTCTCQNKILEIICMWGRSTYPFHSTRKLSQAFNIKGTTLWPFLKDDLHTVGSIELHCNIINILIILIFERCLHISLECMWLIWSNWIICGSENTNAMACDQVLDISYYNVESKMDPCICVVVIILTKYLIVW
jgi:hypothetical protein